MRLENRLNSLIRAGRHVIDSDFDVQALHEWKKEAWECVSVLSAPDRDDTTQFDVSRAGHHRTNPKVWGDF